MAMSAAHSRRSGVGPDVCLLGSPILLEHGGKSAGSGRVMVRTGLYAFCVLPSEVGWGLAAVASRDLFGLLARGVGQT